MAGTPLSLFSDWLKSTNEKIITGPNDVLNEVVSQTYFLGDLMKGKGVGKVVRSGTTFTDRIQLSDTTQFGWYNPNEAFNPSNDDVLQTITNRFRFAKNNWVYTNQELMLNEGDQLTQFKNLRNVKMNACKTNTLNNLEQALWATPSTTTMEAATGTRPYSIRAFITEDGAMPAGFSTLEGIDATVYTRWKNKVANYTIASIDTTLIPAFDEMFHLVVFQAPPTAQAYMADTNFSKFKILTNKDGRKKYMQLTRDSNDRATPANDLGWTAGEVLYNGIPIRYITELDNLSYATTNPRFFWINSDFIYPVFHTERYFKNEDPMNSVQQPFTRVVYNDTWMNLYCGSRQRNGIVLGT